MDPSSREKVLRNIRNALIKKTPQPFPALDMDKAVYPDQQEETDLLFAKHFQQSSGQFIFCESSRECIENLNLLIRNKNWRAMATWDHILYDYFTRQDIHQVQKSQDLGQADAGITRCEALIARTGSILLSSGLASGRALPVFPPVHIVIAFTEQLVYDIGDGIQMMRKKYGATLPSMLSLATGPSRTADIERTLVLGAHGPKEVYVFLLDNPLS